MVFPTYAKPPKPYDKGKWNHDYKQFNPKSLPPAIKPLTQEEKDETYRKPREPGSDDEPLTEEWNYD